LSRAATSVEISVEEVLDSKKEMNEVAEEEEEERRREEEVGFVEERIPFE
jgi:hypothetical protein